MVIVRRTYRRRYARSRPKKNGAINRVILLQRERRTSLPSCVAISTWI